MRISATAASGSVLSVSVEITNVLSEPIYLKNWLWDWFGLLGIPELHELKNPNAPPTRELAYVCLGKDGEAVLLSGDGPIPRFDPQRMIIVCFPRFAESTRLLPGETYRGNIRLPLPLKEWSAHQPPTDAAEPVTVFSVRYRLEILRESNCEHHPVEEVVNFPGVFKAYGSSEIVEATASLDWPVTLLRRTDAFQRFG